jgi:hypothetical protein
MIKTKRKKNTELDSIVKHQTKEEIKKRDQVLSQIGIKNLK